MADEPFEARPEEQLAIPRMVSAGVEDALEKFSDPALLAAGKVNVISVEAVRDRFGPRWQLRADQVHDFTSRVLERGVGATGFYLRMSATDFFIVQPERGRLAGQAACLRYLREVLNHFLGEDSAASAGVLEVTRIARGQVLATEMDARAESVATAQSEEAENGTDAAPPEEPAEKPAEKTMDRWTPFVAADGRSMRVSATLEPVLEAKAFSRIGFRMIRRVLVTHRGEEEELPPQQVSKLSTADLLRVDLATIARGVDRLKAEKEQQLSLIIPVSFTSLSTQKGRTELVQQLREAGGLVKLGVICEICDIEGVPQGALLSATSLVRPFTLLVVGQLAAVTPAAVARLDGTGLQAISFDCPPNLGDAEFIGWARASITTAKRNAKAVMVYRATPGRAGALASLGATHVGLAAG